MKTRLSELTSIFDPFLASTWLHFGSINLPKSCLGGVLERLGRVLEASGGVSGASWSVLGASWGPPGASWVHLGTEFAKSRKTFKNHKILIAFSWSQRKPKAGKITRLGAILDHLGAILGRLSALGSHLGAGHFQRSGGHFQR